ncbi:MAG: hypothetical protein PHE02_15045 [Lachnospiraceae bacterium]|nr:hypothetical protein [Lachnospiraceae bacterium]
MLGGTLLSTQCPSERREDLNWHCSITYNKEGRNPLWKTDFR